MLRSEGYPAVRRPNGDPQEGQTDEPHEAPSDDQRGRGMLDDLPVQQRGAAHGQHDKRHRDEHSHLDGNFPHVSKTHTLSPKARSIEPGSFSMRLM